MPSSFFRLLSLGIVFGLWFSLSGMLCGRAIDVAVRVKKDFVLQMSIGDVLQEAGIAAVDGKIPAGINRTLPLRVADTIDLATNSEFERYKDRVRGIYVNRVWIEVESNALTLDLPAVSLSIAPGLKPTQDEFDKGKIATFAAIPRQSSGQRTTLLWEEGGLTQTAELLRTFKLSLQASTPVEIREATPYPTGEIVIRLEFEMTFSVSPL